MKIESIKENVSTLWDSLSEGWRQLSQSASNALTRFRSGDTTNLPAPQEVDDEFYFPSRSWAMLGGELFEDDNRIVVRIEIPGLSKQDIDVKVVEDRLIISGEKRFERENSNGRWRMMERAYGSFSRVVPLHTKVDADAAQASYRDGILRIELPKLSPGHLKGTRVTVA